MNQVGLTDPGAIAAAKLLQGKAAADVDLSNLVGFDRELTDSLVAINGASRMPAFEAKIADRPDRAYILQQVLAPDPLSKQAAPLLECPPLPATVPLRPELAVQTASWVNRYIRYAESVSPMTPRLFHQSAGLWIPSVAIARRLVLRMPFGDIYPNLWILWLAETTLYRKTTALDVARRLARKVAPHLLAAQETTPEALLSDMAGREPKGLADMTPDEQERWKRERNYAAQRGWMVDEISGLLAAAGRDYNAGQLEGLLRFYDCDEDYLRSTRGQGRVTVRNAYLSLLGASTPAAMNQHLLSERLWAMGWWPRYALLTPESDRPEWREPTAEGDFPYELAYDLQALCNRLPAAEWPKPADPLQVTVDREAFALWSTYNKTLSYDLVVDGIEPRLCGAYGRLPTHALKVAMILAAQDWTEERRTPHIQIQHMTAALLITEQWRSSAHRTIALASAGDTNAKLERLVRQVARIHPTPTTFRELCKGMRDLTPTNVQDLLQEAISAGRLEHIGSAAGERGRPTDKYKLASG